MKRRGRNFGPRPAGFDAVCSECRRVLRANVNGIIPRHKSKFRWCLGSGYQGLGIHHAKEGAPQG